MVRSNRKINIASYRVLCTLICLFEKSRTMNEIIDYLNANAQGEFNNFVVSKYINTCRSCGIDIQKVDGKYTIINMPIGYKFSKKDSALMHQLVSLSEDLGHERIENIMKNILEKTHLLYFKSGTGFKSSKNKRIIKLFEQALNSNCNIDIVYKDNTQQNCCPKGIDVNGDKVSFKIQNGTEIKDINPDDIFDIKLQNSSKAKYIDNAGIVFELKGKLAERYQPREYEQIIKFKPNGAIVVINKYEDKNILLHRLMRYGSLCKVVKPDSCAEDMKNLISATLNNYT